MREKLLEKWHSAKGKVHFWALFFLVLLAIFLFLVAPGVLGDGEVAIVEGIKEKFQKEDVEEVLELPVLDFEDYDRRMNLLANNPLPKEPATKPDTEETVLMSVVQETEVAPKPNSYLWPKESAYPNPGAVLPFNRVVAYYGNLYSKKMGALGEYPREEMLERLNAEVEAWEAADPETPVVPALHYIAVVAQADPGRDGMYRFRMPDSQIEKVLDMAAQIKAEVFLDLQVGLSDVATEVKYFEKYFMMDHVHLGLDPEFAMHNGSRPGTRIGTLDAADINHAIDYLSEIVRENNLKPKMLVIHRFTERMVTNYDLIKPTPEVQVVMHMDGWGGKAKKKGTYRQVIYPEPVQFAGFKIFYKNDTKDPGTTIYTPEELLKLRPKPIYIQYQ